ncbi:cell division control protein 2 homolog 2-like [Cornus florida]|uniref:cell division control protein 2 homolog 2-like n=1 Tax=Cornus florida TaxID=4283 RepID=UPI0028A1E752|nr:cell division control protein 2 homolog 2-like [Cornus florida]
MEDQDPNLSLEQLNQMNKKYKFTEVIGSGSFGLVYKARDRGENKFVAIKIICITDDKEGVPSSLIREVSLLKDLNHDNIIRLKLPYVFIFQFLSFCWGFQ